MSSVAEARAALQQLVDLFVLGLGRPEDVPGIAAQALAAGLETSVLFELAGGENEDLRSIDIERLLKVTAREIGLVDGPPPDALMRLASQVAAQILAGEQTEIEGSRRIWNLSLAAEAHPPATLHTFIYVASEWDQRPDMHDEFCRAVRQAARPDSLQWPSEP